MKPENIILIRHGQSKGNVDRNVFEYTPDYSLHLTELGKAQAIEAGKTIKTLIGNTDPVQFYVSPFWRTRETYKGIIKGMYEENPNRPPSEYYEDPRIREQEWGHYRNLSDTEEIETEREEYGHFYYRFPDGESCADVYDRVSSFFNTMHRDFEKPDFAKNAVVVSHGMTIRLFLMRWFHYSSEKFEEIANPKNCEHFVLKLNHYTNKYELQTPLRKHEVKHKYQFNWNAE